MENYQTSFSNIKSCEHEHVLFIVQCSCYGITVYKISKSQDIRNACNDAAWQQSTLQNEKPKTLFNTIKSSKNWS